MKYLRRLIWYISSRLLVICCILALMVTAFYLSMNATNIYVVVKDGMARRAQVVMMGQEEDLTRYFVPAYLERDEMLDNTLFQDYYSITGFDHRIKLDSFWCWPWDDTARATVTERIPAVDGKLRASARDSGLPATPQWQSARYSVLLSRENGRWRIKNMTVSKYLTDE